jgi:hypothetical protein
VSEKTVVVMRKKWVIKEVPPNTEIGSDETTYKVVSGPIEIAGYWFSVKAAKRNIRRQYRQHLEREGP